MAVRGDQPAPKIGVIIGKVTVLDLCGGPFLLLTSVTGGPDKLNKNAVVLLGARWLGDLGILAPIYFRALSTASTIIIKVAHRTYVPYRNE